RVVVGVVRAVYLERAGGTMDLPLLDRAAVAPVEEGPVVVGGVARVVVGERRHLVVLQRPALRSRQAGRRGRQVGVVYPRRRMDDRGIRDSRHALASNLNGDLVGALFVVGMAPLDPEAAAVSGHRACFVVRSVSPNDGGRV